MPRAYMYRISGGRPSRDPKTPTRPPKQPTRTQVGTPLYMAAEVLRGDEYSWESDLWSLGCLLYELAQLRSPFKQEKEPLPQEQQQPQARGKALYALFQRISLVRPHEHFASASSPFENTPPTSHHTHTPHTTLLYHRATTPRSPASTARSSTSSRTRSSPSTPRSARASRRSAASPDGCASGSRWRRLPQRRRRRLPTVPPR